MQNMDEVNTNTCTTLLIFNRYIIEKIELISGIEKGKEIMNEDLIEIWYLMLSRLYPGKRGSEYPTRWIWIQTLSLHKEYYTNGFISGNGYPSPISNANPASAQGAWINIL